MIISNWKKLVNGRDILQITGEVSDDMFAGLVPFFVLERYTDPADTEVPPDVKRRVVWQGCTLARAEAWCLEQPPLGCSAYRITYKSKTGRKLTRVSENLMCTGPEEASMQFLISVSDAANIPIPLDATGVTNPLFWMIRIEVQQNPHTWTTVWTK